MYESDGKFSFRVGPRTRPDPAKNDVVLSDEGELGTDQVLSNPENLAHGITRKVLRPELIWSNPKDPTALIRASLRHQRRGTNAAAQGDVWEDPDSFNLATLNANEEVRLHLRSGETKRLLLSLVSLYREVGTFDEIMAELGLTVVNSSDSLIVEGREKQILERLYEVEGDELFNLLDEIHPGLTRTIGLRRQHDQREAALIEFERHINAGVWQESDWQEFFEWNTWIFGFGLAYQFLHRLNAQPLFGGIEISGLGGERGDFLMASEAAARFTVLVEIKTPETSLLRAQPYRRNSGYFGVSNDLVGGISQVQANCETWLREGSLRPQDLVRLNREWIHTHEPKGILISGHTQQLDDEDQVGSFERFRRSVRNPEIVTFDELLVRAKYLVETDYDLRSSELQSMAVDIDDIPF